MGHIRFPTVLALTLCISGSTLAQVKTLPSTPYLGQNTTRTYYLSDLESCPGVLDMQLGDLWTLTFPDNITNFFLTRPGLVDVKSQGNRLIIAALASTGNIPLKIITENSDAPAFMITLKNGPGNHLKDVRILSGSQKKACQINAEADANPSPAPLAIIKTSQPAAKLVKPAAQAASPSPARIKIIPPQKTATIRTPQPPANQSATPVATQAEAVSNPQPLQTSVTEQSAPRAAPHTFWNPPGVQNGVAQVYADNSHGIQLKAQPVSDTELQIQLINTLDTDVTFNLTDLNYGNVGSKQKSRIVIAAGETVTQTVQMNGYIRATRVRTNNIEWTGRLDQTGEAVTLRGRVAL